MKQIKIHAVVMVMKKYLTQITIDQFTQKMLDDKRYTLETVPAKGELVLLKPTANLSTGGTSTDVTDEVHPANIFMCERIAKIIGLDICGIDIMATDLRTPVNRKWRCYTGSKCCTGFPYAY